MTDVHDLFDEIFEPESKDQQCQVLTDVDRQLLHKEGCKCKTCNESEMQCQKN